MSYADEVFIRNCRDILTHGVWDTDQAVRPHWEDDGAPAHTVKKFGIVNRYDLSKEFPLLTLRRTYWKTAVDELLWIWQQKSNNIHDLRGHIWDQWADETGSIGKAYGYQLGVKHGQHTGSGSPSTRQSTTSGHAWRSCAQSERRKSSFIGAFRLLPPQTAVSNCRVGCISVSAFLSCPASRPRESPWRCRGRSRAAHSKTRSGRCAPRCRG